MSSLPAYADTEPLKLELPPLAAEPRWLSALPLAPEQSSGGLTVAQRRSRSDRLWVEASTVLALGVAAPFAAWSAGTSGQSFEGFFAGFGGATAVGLLAAPTGVIIAGHVMGHRDRVWAGIAGAALGLIAAGVPGLLLATAPGPLYLAGLGLLWAGPAAGAMVGLEWGVDDAVTPAAIPGALTVRF